MVSISFNFILIAVTLFARKPIKDKIMARLFKKRIKARFITADHKEYSRYVSKTDEKHFDIGNTKRILEPERVLFDLDNGNVPTYTYIGDNALPHDFYNEAAEFDGKILNDLMLSAEASESNLLKFLLKYKQVFYIVAGIGLGVLATTVLTFQMNNTLNSIELCKLGASVIQ